MASPAYGSGATSRRWTGAEGLHVWAGLVLPGRSIRSHGRFTKPAMRSPRNATWYEWARGVGRPASTSKMPGTATC